MNYLNIAVNIKIA